MDDVTLTCVVCIQSAHDLLCGQWWSMLCICCYLVMCCKAVNEPSESCWFGKSSNYLVVSVCALYVITLQYVANFLLCNLRCDML
jgi:hypothetical protein